MRQATAGKAIKKHFAKVIQKQQKQCKENVENLKVL